jgi:hypothetical protein
VRQDRGRVFELSGSLTKSRTPADPSLGAVGPGSNAGPHFFVPYVAARRADGNDIPSKPPPDAAAGKELSASGCDQLGICAFADDGGGLRAA